MVQRTNPVSSKMSPSTCHHVEMEARNFQTMMPSAATATSVMASCFLSIAEPKLLLQSHALLERQIFRRAADQKCVLARNPLPCIPVRVEHGKEQRLDVH